MNSPAREFSYGNVRESEEDLGIQLQSVLFEDLTYQIPVESMNNDILESELEESD